MCWHPLSPLLPKISRRLLRSQLLLHPTALRLCPKAIPSKVGLLNLFRRQFGQVCWCGVDRVCNMWICLKPKPYSPNPKRPKPLLWALGFCGQCSAQLKIDAGYCTFRPLTSSVCIESSMCYRRVHACDLICRTLQSSPREAIPLAGQRKRRAVISWL